MGNAEDTAWGIQPSGRLGDATAVVAWPVVAVQAECRAETPTDALSRLVVRLVGAGATTPDDIALASGLSSELVQVVLDHQALLRRVRRSGDKYALTSEGESVAEGEDAPAPARTAWFLVCARTGDILPVRYWEELPDAMRWGPSVVVEDPGTLIDPADAVFGARLRAVASWCDAADASRTSEADSEPLPEYSEFVDHSEGRIALGPPPEHGGPLGEPDPDDADENDVVTTGVVERRKVLLGLRAGARPGELRVSCPWPGADDRFFVERLVGLPQQTVRDVCDRLLAQSDREAASETVRLASDAIKAQLDADRFPWGALSDLPDQLRSEVEAAEIAWFRVRASSGRPHEVIGGYRKAFEALLASVLPGAGERARSAVRAIPADRASRQEWIRQARARWPLSPDAIGDAVQALQKAGDWQRVKPQARHGQRLIALLALAVELAPDLLDEAVLLCASPLREFVLELAATLTALHKGSHPASCQLEDAASSRERVQALIAAIYAGASDGSQAR